MRDPAWIHFSRHTLAAAVVVAAAAPALAQNTTSAISGRVTGPDGAGIAQANVAILHVDSGTLVNATTDGDGRYVARGLRVGGPFTITVSKGTLTERRDGVFTALAETLNQDWTLPSAAQTIVVTGQGLSSTFNRNNMGAGTGIGNRDLNALASVQRNLQDYARTDPRLSQTDKERGEISAAGQNSRYNSITIDGVKTNDTFGLEANNLPTAKQPISIDAIQSVQVNVSNYDATQKGYTGANINAVTKSGTNEFAGSIYVVYRNDELVGDRYNRANDTYSAAPNFSERTRGVTLGGPIVKDRLFFFASYEELVSTRNAPDFGPIGSPVTNVAITQNFIDAVSAAARTTYGIDLGSSDASGGTKLEVKDKLVKLDWNISDDHRASLRYAKTDQTEPFYTNFSQTGLSLSSNWYSIDKSLETVVGQWFADWTPSFSTELKVSRRKYDSISSPNSQLPQIVFQPTSTVPAGFPTGARSLFTGTERSRQDNILRTKTTDGYLGASWQLGSHELKGGADISRNEVFNAFIQDIYGNYTFRCINSSAAFTYNTVAGNVTCTDPAQTEAALIENFNRGRPFQYTVKTPVAGKTISDGEANFTITESGAYLQDTWNLNRQITLMFGARVDRQSTNDKPAFNAAASAAPGPADAATGRATGGFGLDNSETIDGATLVQPRFGFNWALPTERRMQLRGGAGLFQGAAPTVWLANPYSNTGVAIRTLGCGGSFANCGSTVGQFSANPNAPYVPNATAPAADVDFLDSGLGQPAVWKANLAFETELPWWGLVAGVEALHTRVKHAIYYQHLNLGAPTATGAADGRPNFYSDQARNPACWNPTTGASITTGTTCTGFITRRNNNLAFNNVLLAKETSKGSGNVFTVSLQQPLRDGLNWGAAYSRQTSKEVSPLTSSVSNSNWAARSSFDPNENVAANSAYLVRDRFNGNLTFSRATDGKYRTTVGVFYEGRSGKPYSWTYRNDFNGDGTTGNDLMYIPRGPGSGEVVFTGLGEDAFWNTVSQYKQLDDKRGSVVKRNSTLSPFTHTFDVRLSQEFPGFYGKQKLSVALDVLNIGNLLNKNWGNIEEMAFQSGGGATRSFVNFGGIDSSGRYVYNVVPVNDYTTRQARGESQWAAQVTVRYEF